MRRSVRWLRGSGTAGRGYRSTGLPGIQQTDGHTARNTPRSEIATGSGRSPGEEPSEIHGSPAIPLPHVDTSCKDQNLGCSRTAPRCWEAERSQGATCAQRGPGRLSTVLLCPWLGTPAWHPWHGLLTANTQTSPRDLKFINSIFRVLAPRNIQQFKYFGP